MLLLLFFIGLIVWISEKFGSEAGGIAFLVILVLTIIMVARDNRKDIEAYYNWRDYWLTGRRVRNRKEEEARIVEAERAVRKAEREVKRLEREVKKEPPQAVETPVRPVTPMASAWEKIYECPSCGRQVYSAEHIKWIAGRKYVEFYCPYCQKTRQRIAG